MEEWNTKYPKRMRVSEEDWEWLMQNYKAQKFKSAAAFLEALINQTKERKERE